MAKAALASVQLARFDRLREAGPVPEVGAPGTLFCNVAAVRASMTGVPGLRSQQSFLFPGVLE